MPPEGEDQVIPLDRLVKLTREGVRLPFTPAEGSIVLFPDGDRLYRAVIGPATETALEVQSYALGNLAIPLESLLGLVLAPPAETAAVDALLARVRTEPRTRRSSGWPTATGCGGVPRARRQEDQVPGRRRARSSSIVRGSSRWGSTPALIVYPQPKGDFLELTMADGSRLGVTEARIEQGQVVATTRFKSTIRLALERAGPDSRPDGAIVYLSERAVDGRAVRRLSRPDTALSPRPQRGRPPAPPGGAELRPGPRDAEPNAARLPAGCRRPRFQALVGLDDSAGPLGSVVFRVLVDGRAAVRLAADVGPRHTEIDRHRPDGGQSPDPGDRVRRTGEVRDFADWVEARIIH